MVAKPLSVCLSAKLVCFLFPKSSQRERPQHHRDQVPGLLRGPRHGHVGDGGLWQPETEGPGAGEAQLRGEELLPPAQGQGPGLGFEGGLV